VWEGGWWKSSTILVTGLGVLPFFCLYRANAH